jgi:hypothetical protein
VGRVEVLDGLPDGPNDAAVDMARKPTFEPAKDEGGEPVGVWLTVSVSFTVI